MYVGIDNKFRSFMYIVMMCFVIFFLFFVELNLLKYVVSFFVDIVKSLNC